MINTWCFITDEAGDSKFENITADTSK